MLFPLPTQFRTQSKIRDSISHRCSIERKSKFQGKRDSRSAWATLCCARKALSQGGGECTALPQVQTKMHCAEGNRKIINRNLLCREKYSWTKNTQWTYGQHFSFHTHRKGTRNPFWNSTTFECHRKSAEETSRLAPNDMRCTEAWVLFSALALKSRTVLSTRMVSQLF